MKTDSSLPRKMTIMDRVRLRDEEPKVLMTLVRVILGIPAVMIPIVILVGDILRPVFTLIPESIYVLVLIGGPPIGLILSLIWWISSSRIEPRIWSVVSIIEIYAGWTFLFIGC